MMSFCSTLLYVWRYDDDTVDDTDDDSVVFLHHDATLKSIKVYDDVSAIGIFC
jgi:hypothetical protein